MRNILLLISFLAITAGIQAQFPKKILDKAKEKVNKKVDDATAGKTEKAEKTEENNTETKETEANPAAKTNEPASFKTYSKFDFIPGEKVIGFEDFSTGAIGDFPAGWNTDASAEIVTVEGKPGRWLWFTKRGVFTPEFPAPFPDDFTFEFDLLHGIPINGAHFLVIISELSNPDQPQYYSNATNVFTIELSTANTTSSSGVTRFSGRKNSSTDIQNSDDAPMLNDKNNPAHISIWRQKERVRVYVNDQKIWDIPKAASKDAKFNAIVFYVTYAEEVVKHFVGNLRFAVGAPDTRNKLLTQNKWVTHGILFDVNSDKIKPESYGTLKEMASVLKEFPELKVKIVGHTDADGSDAANLDLSKRRSAAVKASLAADFGITETRMETDGKGESEPIDKNDSLVGKANNRRVEFIKL
ncbi:OmpA family protein [Niastella caeni]|uniref:OmpA family protein n=1 Tax=Niastella caeni TaxID=2569763 RepID=A0A4S8HXY7_9BACT|nr:OmpA family protein [Niastella caeni]THU40567.1 OmpA family protein [Niastella caeni]